ncbi:2-aminoethylphosphonate--pyruvate transaminase [Bisbaumannia pacifica]|uniref:2-aminoethylphosphonate--pyruvate transaminase n=2 Tax=Bisbaumannia pacifica TaxID=77098 RepID=A0A510X5R5_9GAMM|nr:2-aminoethylphosphonate--pyruvate transaminase [Halomonas pacifica]GEK46749.1 2-aminoethylphosphonate--pyruvate transaminase [Halomonas pacifica]
MLDAMTDPYLLTPGPLTTSATVKAAMRRDWGSWDSDFNAMTAEICRRLLAHANARDSHACVPLQGSGTFAVEAALGTLIDPARTTLVLSNGAYGKRLAALLERMGRPFEVLDSGDTAPPSPRAVAERLKANPAIGYVAVIHCETSSGILNPLAAIAEAVAAEGRELIVDSMSAFGAVPVDARRTPFLALVSSANKCFEGVPGFGFVIARRDALAAASGRCHSLSLDLHDQWRYLERTGQWRYTPPTHVVAAFRQALDEHDAEGGVAGRLARYTANRDALVAGMRRRGFATLLEDRWLSPIITTFLSPAHPGFDFPRFYAELKARGFIIYPGKLTEVESFRIGSIGRLDVAVIARLLEAVDAALATLGVDDCRPAA